MLARFGIPKRTNQSALSRRYTLGYTFDVTPSRAIALIRECLDQGRVKVHRHFVERMVERGLFWPDVLAIVEHPNGARCDGVDSLGRPRWLVRGDIAPDCPPSSWRCWTATSKGE